MISLTDYATVSSENIDKEASLTATIHQLAVSQAQSMLVTRNGDTVGILRPSELFEEVANRIRLDHTKEQGA